MQLHQVNQELQQGAFDAADQASQAATERIYSQQHEINTIFLEYPELQPYFFENEELPTPQAMIDLSNCIAGRTQLQGTCWTTLSKCGFSYFRVISEPTNRHGRRISETVLPCRRCCVPSCKQTLNGTEGWRGTPCGQPTLQIDVREPNRPMVCDSADCMWRPN